MNANLTESLNVASDSTKTFDNSETKTTKIQFNKEPNPKRIKFIENHTDLNSILTKIISPSSNQTMSSNESTTNTEITQLRSKRLSTIKSSPILTQVVSSKNQLLQQNRTINITNDKNKKILIESLNIIEPQAINKKPIRTSPNKSKSINQTKSTTQTISKTITTTTSTTTTTTTTNTNTSNSSLNQSNRNSFACLRNLGSTCYINCIIQVMRYTPGFVLSINRLNKQIDYLKSLKNADIDSEINRNNDVMFVKNLHELLVEMSKIEQSDRRPIFTPRKFVNTVWTSLSFWSDGSQQDAHEFLQYTIHFINECDLHIRKIQQQYQIKQIPINDKNDLITVSSNTQNTSQTITDSIQKLKPTRTSLSRKPSKTTQETLIESPQKNLKQNITTTIMTTNQTNLNEILTLNNTSHLLTDESSSSSTSSTCSSSASSTSAISSSTYQSCIIKQDQIRLIKTLPKLNPNNSICTDTNNFMRTPTKGGASSFNISMLDSLTNNKNSSISQKSSNKVTFKQTSEDELIFRPMIKSDSGDLTKREPIKVKFQLDKTNENYRIVAPNSQNTNISSNLIIDDKDLVSKRLKETLKSDSNLSQTSQRINKQKNVDDISINNKNKRFKQESNYFNLNDLDTSNIILIDSDDNDDEVYFMDDDDNNDEVLKRNNFSTKISKENNNNKNEEVLDEVIKIESKEQDEQSTNEYELKDCFVLLKKIEYENVKLANNIEQEEKSEKKLTESICLNESLDKSIDKNININNKNKPQNLKKLKSKSKTFPHTTSLPLLPTENSNFSFENSITDLDAITIVNTNRSSLNSQSSNNLNYETTNLRSKLRSNSSSQNLRNISPVKSPLLPLPSLNLNTANSAPPSPAELLRKYSSSIGYVCEMDKLFKGSSITVTQCLECENLRKCPESFYDRSIPIETTTVLDKQQSLVDDDDKDESSCWITKCLSNESYLNENSKYMCDQCASKQEAKIHTQYTHMPNILILHLLSYGITSSDDGNLNTRKLSNRLRLVNYFDYMCKKEELPVMSIKTESTDSIFKSPITTRRQLQLKKEQFKENTSNSSDSIKHSFKLFAVVMHSGVSLNSGHYTAFVNYKIINQQELTNSVDLNEKLTLRSQSSQISNDQSQHEWLHFDDTKVKSLSNNEFQRKIVDSNYDSPYILFYVRD